MLLALLDVLHQLYRAGVAFFDVVANFLSGSSLRSSMRRYCGFRVVAERPVIDLDQEILAVFGNVDVGFTCRAPLAE